MSDRDPRDFPRAAATALDNERAAKPRSALMKAGFQDRRRRAMAALPDFEGMREHARAIRDYALSHLDDLLKRFESQVHGAGRRRALGARRHRSARHRRRASCTQRGARTVTKGKSMLGEEIELNAHLEAHGIMPIETDLGEYIVQLRGETAEPHHRARVPSAPRGRGRLFREAHTDLDRDRDLDDRADLVAEARAVLRERFLAADAGITGANFLVAETGTAVIVTNEGNGDLTRLLPKTHIVLAGIEKVVETLTDASLLAAHADALGHRAGDQHLCQLHERPAAADGKRWAAEHSMSSCSTTAASALFGSPRAEVLRCIRCAACINHCPVYGAVGGHAYGAVYSGPIGAALMPGLEGVAEAHILPNASTFCGRCDEVCPVKIPLTRIMRHWRDLAFTTGGADPVFAMALRAWAKLAREPARYVRSAERMARMLRRFGGMRIRWLPVFRAWFRERDLPAPAAETFQTQWRKRHAEAEGEVEVETGAAPEPEMEAESGAGP